MSEETRSWVASTAGSAVDKVRDAAPETYDRAAQAANYVGESIRQYPVAGTVAGALVGYGLGFLLHHQWSSTDSARYIRGGDDRSRTASNTADSAEDRARSAARETYNRAARAKDSATQYALVVALLSCALGFLAKR
jgi:hypothetical protein